MSKDVQYDLDAMEKAIVKANDNIKIFEDAIVNEYNTITEYRKIIKDLRERES